MYREIENDFELRTEVSFDGKHRFDQAGLCIRFDEDNWVKTSAEFETEEMAHLGAVVTNLGYSDWSTQEIPSSVKKIEFKLIRKGQDVEIYARHGDRKFEQIRVAHLHQVAKTVKAGIYACSPTERGYVAIFHRLEIVNL